MKNVLITMIMLCLIFPAIAAYNDLPPLNLNPFNLKSPGLNKLKMSHSMGFEAGSSSTGRGYYLSRYTNHMRYQFNPKLELDLDLNFVNFGSLNTSSKFSLNDDNNNKILPEFSLRYRPSDSMTFEIQMRQGLFMQQTPWHDKW
ncbi:MAG: hypothetical protein PHY41_05915 [Candidatus Cloacimonetes bacterium]|jgi:hypothetical protein|nr:hypothetical protein [Candidatus Cloacimonadota bacterium]MDY0299747.1 hypothetical protein [Candidatus Cloacimonadaceae bacterium]MCB5279115.1 hypothetical protein [Candidatus Cloacimonadota bacterium]MCK9333197.1 hypothetical protein [Candidatus Cloacimonadota bacterium]MDD2211163.1 hypothetical protein [Candidatus Cloacimonadota bacterium]